MTTVWVIAKVKVVEVKALYFVSGARYKPRCAHFIPLS